MFNRVTPPDFGSFFGSENRDPIEFRCRDGANLFHDLIFLSSYLHDAVFDPRKIQFLNMILRIPMQRDRWELSGGKEIESIDTELTISPVVSIKWQQKKPNHAEEQRSQIKTFSASLHLPSRILWDCSDHGELVLSSHGEIKLRIEIADSVAIRLTDLTENIK
jgi:hypothetical protein